MHLPILAQQAQEQQVQNQTEAAAKQAPEQVEEDRTKARRFDTQASQQVEEDQTEAGRFDNKLHNK